MSDKNEIVDMPGTSTEKEQEPNDSIYSEASKQRLKTAIDYSLLLLAEENLITSESSEV